MGKHHSTQHDILGKLVCFRFHHVDRVYRAGHDHVEVGIGHLFLKRVQDVFAVDIGNTGSTDRAHERDARNGQRRRRADERGDIGIVFKIMRHHGADHLSFIPETTGEQRTQRTVDKAGRQRFLFGRTAFALEKAARDFTGGKCLFLVVDRQREKIDPRLRRFLRHSGAEYLGFAIGDHDGPVSLPGNFPGFDDERTTAPLNFFTVFGEHILHSFLSPPPYVAGPVSHRQCALMRPAGVRPLPDFHARPPWPRPFIHIRLHATPARDFAGRCAYQIECGLLISAGVRGLRSVSHSAIDLYA